MSTFPPGPPPGPPPGQPPGPPPVGPTGPPPGAFGPPTADGDPGPERRSAIGWLVGGGVLLVVALITAVVVLAGGDDDDTASGAPTEVFLEPISSTRDPFTDPVGEDEEVTPPDDGTTTTTEDETTTTTDEDEDEPVTAISSSAGGEPGLYGGTQLEGSCDKEQLVSFLESDPEKASAWAAVQGIAVDDIADFVDGSTPVILRYDTRVTNHGYVDGVATPLQSVLQAGTAVLVNEYGRPVVKCYCGNPLGPPVAAPATYTGEPWDDFDEERITVVVENTVVVETFVLVDINTGETFDLPRGSDGSVPDEPDPTSTTTTTTTTTEPTTTTTEGSTSTTEGPVDEVLTGTYDYTATSDDPVGCPTSDGSFDLTITGTDGADKKISIAYGSGSVDGTVKPDNSFKAQGTFSGTRQTIEGRFLVEEDPVGFEAENTLVSEDFLCVITIQGQKAG